PVAHDGLCRCGAAPLSLGVGTRRRQYGHLVAGAAHLGTDPGVVPDRHRAGGRPVRAAPAEGRRRGNLMPTVCSIVLRGTSGVLPKVRSGRGRRPIMSARTKMTRWAMAAGGA